ncbi:MAG TPA: helix-turn-helix domain-containing protein [Devosia sp.]|jgi:AcrR family transcriptional regulator|uniref:TetR/AcrR family transcriptional regulator n=1 Tax=Devosia sp. TaxID=1871048 RepID=UPI002DDD853E|nr:helix-turn-helix domain-containing protein [Devosia sp.]HEV2514621.1 helix-turn-helix domain-containing protein [Devosia sp.]
MSSSSPSADRRSEILDAALACFLEQGYLATSIADIRRESGASTGSIYHFFDNKGALALALVERAIGGWSGRSGVAVDPDAAAETAIKASVSGLVRWGLANPAALRFLDEVRGLATADASLAPVAGLLARGNEAARARYALFVARGEVRDLPWPLAHALMLGPAYDFLRLAGDRAPPGAELALADAAWNAIRAP